MCIQACVCPQRERMQRQSLGLIYMGQCLCTDPYTRTKSRRGRLPPPSSPLPSAASSPPDDNRHGNSTKSRTRPWSVHCGDQSLRRNWKVPPSEDELKLGHIQNELSGQREQVVEEHRDVHDHRHSLQHSCTAPPLFPPPSPQPLPPNPLAATTTSVRKVRGELLFMG